MKHSQELKAFMSAGIPEQESNIENKANSYQTVVA